MNIKLIDNGKIHYGESMAHQKALFDKAIEAKHRNEPVQHHLIFNEHYPVLTLGKHGDHNNILYSEEYLHQHGIELYNIGRGGDVTYHGPGQWTIYPIFDLEELGIGIRDYVDALEEVAIRVADKYGVRAGRIKGASGVWITKDNGDTNKLCAVGIQASRYVTMHGIAFNVSTDPKAFSIINPCGFTDRGVTNLSIESGRVISMSEAKEELIKAFSSVFDRDIEL
ncbi:lipoyl(octanoyl) transferase LipB [Porphyromonadaceae bacterium W3.11]|nr:lipoyl(octanoyl) transferase LipB [Porphyromonadaceae bacterium W3.11]